MIDITIFTTDSLLLFLSHFPQIYFRLKILCLWQSRFKQVPRDRKKADMKKCRSVDESGCVSVCSVCCVHSVSHWNATWLCGVCVGEDGWGDMEVDCLHSRGIHVFCKPQGTRDFCPNPPKENHHVFLVFTFSLDKINICDFYPV